MSHRRLTLAPALALLCSITAVPLAAAPLLAASAGSGKEHPAACLLGGLPPGGIQSCSITPQDFTFTQETDHWAAVGVRAFEAPDDWDIRLYDNAAPEPTCVANILSASTATTLADFVVGDYNHSPLTQEYVRVNRFAGTQVGVVEWDTGDDQVIVNGPYIFRDTGYDDILEIWDIQLTAGTTYTFEILPLAADCKLLLFRNPANSPYWASRGSRVLETSSTTTYTAPATDYYGLVVVNDNGVLGRYSFRVKQCVGAVALTSGTAVSVTPPQTAFSFDQPWNANYWSALGVRQPSADWDIGAYGATGPGPSPACFATPLASSTSASGTDFVIGDFNVNPRTTYYVEAFPYSGSGSPGTLEWDDGTDQVVVNGPIVSRTTGPNDVLEAWDVNMSLGQQYTLEFVPTGADLRLHLFVNPGSNPYWTNRAGAVLSTATTTTYTATSSAFNGLVVLNNNGAAGSYTLCAGSCTTPFALESGTTLTINRSVEYFSFAQGFSFWTAVGVRQQAADWDLDVWANGSGAMWSTCYSNQLANSTGNGTVDFVVGDFNHNTLGTYYVRPYRDSGPFQSDVEWDSGGEEIEPNELLVERTTGPTDVLEVWDAFLTEGVTYDLFFARNGQAATKLLLFRNLGATFWAPRSARVLETTATNTSYTAPATDWYGIVVVNDNRLTGTYKLGIATNVSDAGGGTPEVTALRRVGPNPSRGAVEIGFDLREPASVGIRVVDVAGRLVATLPRRDWPAGRWSTSWDGADASGRPIAAGVYYVRMSTADRVIGERKVVVLR